MIYDHGFWFKVLSHKYRFENWIDQPNIRKNSIYQRNLQNIMRDSNPIGTL